MIDATPISVLSFCILFFSGNTHGESEHFHLHNAKGVADGHRFRASVGAVEDHWSHYCFVHFGLETTGHSAIIEGPSQLSPFNAAVSCVCFGATTLLHDGARFLS